MKCKLKGDLDQEVHFWICDSKHDWSSLIDFDIALIKWSWSHHVVKAFTQTILLDQQNFDQYRGVQTCLLPADYNITDPLINAMLQHNYNGHVKSFDVNRINNWLWCKWKIIGVGALKSIMFNDKCSQYAMFMYQWMIIFIYVHKYLHIC